MKGRYLTIDVIPIHESEDIAKHIMSLIYRHVYSFHILLSPNQMNNSGLYLKVKLRAVRFWRKGTS